MKKLTITIAALLLLCLAFGGCASSGDGIEDFVGNWQVVREYQDGRLIADEEMGFYLTIDADGAWTLEDDMARTPKTGELESYEGLPCLYYEDYLFVLEKDGDDLVAHTKYLKDKDFPTGKYIFQRFEKDDFFD